MCDLHNPPRPEVAALIRATTAHMLQQAERLFEEVDQAVLGLRPDSAAADPEVTTAIRTSNRANLAHWGAVNLREPGAHVPPIRSPETLEIGREIVRRGLDDNLLEAYRVGQNIAWRRWMQTAFALSTDHDALREMLDITSRSIFTFVDETLSAIREAMDEERAQLIGRTHTERLEVVNLILEDAQITSQRASARLHYELSRRHTAAIVWSDGVGPQDPGELEAAAAAVSRAARASRPLTVLPSARVLWAWFHATGRPDPAALRSTLDLPGRLRVALGTSEPGLDGFRRSHLNALTTQRLMRRMPPEVNLAAYADVQLVALAAQDEERASDFVASTLGHLATHDDPVLRETLRVYVRENFSASRAAGTLFTHRNTVINRVRRAEELLAVSLADHGLEVGLALEILHWLGPPGPLRRRL